MFYRTIFVCLFVFTLVLSAKEHPPEIIFEINSTRDNRIVCDHTMEELHTYTVREGENFRLITKFNSFINYLNCGNKMFSYNKYTKKGSLLNETTFNVDKDMGNIWKCTIFAHRNNPIFRPMVQYKDANYSVVDCFMKIHVRQTNSPQTILVNNMVLDTLRTDLSIKDIDFTAEYQYADGDEVHLTCANFSNPTSYTMTGTMRDISTIKDLLSAHSAIGFRAKLGAGHHNTYIICNNTGPTDYTKVMVRFLMRTEFNYVSIQINGMTLRPKLTNVLNNHYEIEYKYQKKRLITLVCEVLTDLELVVTERKDGFIKSYNRKDQQYPKKKSEISFLTETAADVKIQCATDYPNGTSAEQVAIHFTAGNYLIDQYLLRMNFLPSNGTVMELDADYKLKVFFYEFEDGETLQLNCGPLYLYTPGPVVYIQFGDSVSDTCRTRGCNVSKTLHLTRKDENTKLVCYLKEENLNEEAEVLREIRVILRERVVTTTSTSTSTTTTTRSIEHEPADQQGMQLAVIAIVILCIIIICVTMVIVKLRKRNHSQGGPHDRHYENLQSPSEASIPAYPTQWESNYAVPVDRRTEDTTYSVPCQEPVLYSTPTPKNLRNKKQKPVEPTYAVLDVPCQKNTFKETDDPNYSEVYARRQEQCYAKVMPKSERKKMAKDDHPYANVSNEPRYVNTVEPEPMYCEPGKAQGRTYANLNNSHYANHVQDQSYAEPTYCEPQTGMK